MADELRSTKTEEQKRRVKNPETFRERAIKATAEDDKPKRGAKAKSGISKFFGKIFNPIGRLLNKIFNHKPFRIIGRILWPKYFRNSVHELRLVTWPKRKQAFDLTFAVLAFAIVFGGVIAGVDYGLDKVFRTILLK